MKAALLLQSVGLLTMQPCERPPVQYQGDPGSFTVRLARPEDVDAECRAAGNQHIKNQILACVWVQKREVLMPQPCLYADNYAQLLCHEAPGHLTGWKH